MLINSLRKTKFKFTHCGDYIISYDILMSVRKGNNSCSSGSLWGFKKINYCIQKLAEPLDS